MKLLDFSGRRLARNFELTPGNRLSFEVALRRALAVLLGEHLSLAGSRLVQIKNAGDFVAALKQYRPRRLVYYGHAIADTKVLLPSLGKSITTWQLESALKGSSVLDFDVLGCSSSSIAAEVVLNVPGIRIGYLLNPREDNIVTDPVTLRVKELTIDRQPVLHFHPRPR